MAPRVILNIGLNSPSMALIIKIASNKELNIGLGGRLRAAAEGQGLYMENKAFIRKLRPREN